MANKEKINLFKYTPAEGYAAFIDSENNLSTTVYLNANQRLEDFYREITRDEYERMMAECENDQAME